MRWYDAVKVIFWSLLEPTVVILLLMMSGYYFSIWVGIIAFQHWLYSTFVWSVAFINGKVADDQFIYNANVLLQAPKYIQNIYAVVQWLHKLISQFSDKTSHLMNNEYIIRTLEYNGTVSGTEIYTDRDFNWKFQSQLQSVIIVVYFELLLMLQMHESVVFHKRMYAAHP